MGRFGIVYSISNDFLSIPLHRVHLVSDLVSGPIVVGVVPRMPMKGVSMLLGKELAGEKITIYPKLELEPVTSTEMEKIEEENPCIFPSYAVTQAQAKGEASKEKFCGLKNEMIDLSQTFKNHNMDFSCPSDCSSGERIALVI